jgi:hypothetical protein
MSKDRFDFKLDDVFIDIKLGLKVTNLRPDEKHDWYIGDVTREDGSVTQKNYQWWEIMHFANANAFAKGKQYVYHNNFKVYTCTGEYRVQEDKDTGKNKLLILVEGGGYLFFDELHTNLTPVFTDEDVFEFKSSIREMYTAHMSACINFVAAFHQLLDVDNVEKDPVKKTIHILDYSNKLRDSLHKTYQYFDK